MVEHEIVMMAGDDRDHGGGHIPNELRDVNVIFDLAEWRIGVELAQRHEIRDEMLES
jgi:hypothetical protein